MTQEPPDRSAASSQLIGLVVLVGAWLYFVGWVYRWIYFSFFLLDVTTLDLPIESFYVAAFQVFFGTPLATLRTILAILIAGLIAYGATRLINQLFRPSKTKGNAPDSFIYLRSLLDEITIALAAFFIAFWLARWQGEADAWKDAVNSTSTLPVITIAASEDTIAIGRLYEDPGDPPNGYRIIGDLKAYENVLGSEISSAESIGIWRLLVDRGGYFYVFPTVDNRESGNRPIVLAIRESDSGDRLVILSPSPLS